MSATSPSRVAAVAVVLLAGLLPLSTSPFVTDTTMASWSLTAAVGVGVAMLAPARDSPPRRLWLACAAGIGVFVAAALVGSTAALSLLGRYPRYEGVITVVGYALALAAGARILGPNSDHRHLFARALSVSSVVTAVVAAGQAVFLPDQRVVGLLGNSSVLGGWAAVTFCLLGWWYLERRDWLILGGAVASALTLVLAASRAAWLGVAVALVASLLVRRAVSIRPPWWLPVGALGVLGIAALLLPGSQSRATGSAPFADATVSGRLLLWQDTWPMLWSHPVLGVGPSVFVDAIAGFHTPAWAAMVGPYAPPDSPHNTVLQFLVATGFVGLVAAGLVAAVLVGAVWRSRPWDGWQAGAIAAGFALGCSGLFSFTDPATATLGLVVLGGAVARPLPSSAPARSAWPGRAAIAVWVAAVRHCWRRPATRACSRRGRPVRPLWSRSPTPDRGTLTWRSGSAPRSPTWPDAARPHRNRRFRSSSAPAHSSPVPSSAGSPSATCRRWQGMPPARSGPWRWPGSSIPPTWTCCSSSVSPRPRTGPWTTRRPASPQLRTCVRQLPNRGRTLPSSTTEPDGPPTPNRPRREPSSSVAAEKTECVGPGAPLGAWPLGAANVGARGYRGPTHHRG